MIINLSKYRKVWELSYVPPSRILYLLVIPLVVYTINLNLIADKLSNIFLIKFVYIGIFLLVGRNDMYPFFQKVDDSWKRTFRSGLLLFGATYLFNILGQQLQGLEDPQGITNITYNADKLMADL